MELWTFNCRAATARDLSIISTIADAGEMHLSENGQAGEKDSREEPTVLAHGHCR